MIGHMCIIWICNQFPSAHPTKKLYGTGEQTRCEKIPGAKSFSDWFSWVEGSVEGLLAEWVAEVSGFWQSLFLTVVGYMRWGRGIECEQEDWRIVRGALHKKESYATG